MSVILFILILAVLILVHEFGHFIVAKKAGMRVDEFGLGLPPRAVKLWEKNGTVYSLNWIPFGGFVKIFGEDFEDAGITQGGLSNSFMSRPKHWQALVLVAGVTMNILFAWLLLSLGFMTGMPTAVDEESEHVKDAEVMVTSVFDDTPAFNTGLQVGDRILAVTSDSRHIERDSVTVENFQNIVGNAPGSVALTIKRGEEIRTVAVTPTQIPDIEQKAIGISLAMVGTLKLPVHLAFFEGASMTIGVTRDIAIGLWNLLFDAMRGNADFSQVTGPVGIAGLVGDARELGFAYLLTFTAFISLNLAVLNLVPFPALDGGRLLFVLIEAIKGSPINPKVFRVVNGIGFGLLLLLMVIVTFNDIVRLF